MKKLLVTTFAFLVLSAAVANAQDPDFQTGLQQFNAKQFEAAAETFRKITLKEPSNDAAFFNYGLSLFNLRKYKESLAPFGKAAQISAKVAKYHEYVGRANLLINDFTNAAAAFWDELLIEPNNFNANYFLGYSLYKAKQYPDAEKYTREAIRIDPKHATAKMNLGMILNGQKRYKDAVAPLTEAIKLNPELSDAHFNLGNAYYNQNLYAESIPYYERSAVLSPKSALVFAYLGDAYLNTKQNQRAVETYKKSIALDAKEVVAQMGLGLAYMNLKNYAGVRTQIAVLQVLDAEKAKDLQQRAEKAGMPPN